MPAAEPPNDFWYPFAVGEVVLCEELVGEPDRYRMAPRKVLAGPLSHGERYHVEMEGGGRRDCYRGAMCRPGEISSNMHSMAEIAAGRMFGGNPGKTIEGFDPLNPKPCR